MIALKRALSLFFCLFLVACAGDKSIAVTAPTETGPSTLTPSATYSPVPPYTPGTIFTPTEEVTRVVSIYIYESGDQRQISTGDFSEVVLVSTPVIYSISRRSDGSVMSTSETPWKSHQVSEMQVCFSLDTPCDLGDRWIPFELSPNAGPFGEASIQKFKIEVDWVGPRTLWVVTRFRDTNGNPVVSISENYQTPQVNSQTSIQITGVWDTATAIGVQPPTVQTAIATTQIAYPVAGSVLIEEDRCCMGGIAGEILEAHVSFSATSGFGKVGEMRVRTTGICFTENELTDTAWEPFMPSKTYPVYVAINWVGFYASVQYRDERGNLSPVFCDEISVEGHPPMPTNIPAS